jgi:outer membrane protein assembly factor BamB
MTADSRDRRAARRLFGLLTAALALAVAGADWPQFLGPKRDGTSAETGLATTWPRKGPPVEWQREVGEGYSGPVVADGKLILFHRVGDEDVVECLDAATGKGLWKYAYATAYSDALGKGDGPRSTPLIAGGKVYTLGAAGKLLCLGLARGDMVWQRDLLTDYTVPRSYFGVGTTPLLVGDLLLVNVGGKDAGVVAVNKDTGKEAWAATSQGASYASPVAADIDGVRHAIFFTRQGLLGLDPANGKVRYEKRWRSRMDASVNAATPLVLGDRIFLTSSYDTGALLVKASKDKVEELWKGDDILSCHFGTPVHVDGYLYGFDGRQEGGTELRCVELKSGKVMWKQEGFGCGSIIAAQGMLLILSEGGDLVLAEATSAGYREKARATVLGKPCRAAPALSDGKLYARDGGKLVCWNLKK